MKRHSFLLLLFFFGLLTFSPAASSDESGTDTIYAFARQRVEETRRQQVTKMPVWLKENRDAYRDRLAAVAQASFEQTGIWFLARGAAREKDEQETVAVWGDLLLFGDLTTLPSYSEENRQQAIKFWQSWQNLKTGQLYNPLHQDPQNPEVKRDTPGNRKDYSSDTINIKYIPAILGMLGAKLPGPVNTLTAEKVGVDTFDQLWKWIPKWATSPAGAFPVAAARLVDGGNGDKIPQVEAGMGALVRAYNKETGMWRPEPLEGFPWKEYPPSSGFKIVSRICGYVGMENFPEKILKTSIDNLLAHQEELYSYASTTRNYGETMAHYMMLTDYRHDELLDAMELCLEGFRDPEVWENTGTGSYCVFGYAFIGAFMNWEDLPFDQAMPQWGRFEHGCKMHSRFVVGPYGNWVNVIPKQPEAVFGHANYNVKKYGLKARNQSHWSKKIRELVAPKDVMIRLAANGTTGEGTFTFTLTQNQLVNLKAPYLKASWSGAYDISFNGDPVKQVRYNLPDVPAGWYVPALAAKQLRVGENTLTIALVGPGKEPRPDAPSATRKPFLRLGLIDWQ